LSASDAEEGVHSGRRRRSIMRRSARTRRNRGNLGLILASYRAAGAPLHRSRQGGCHSYDCSLILAAVRVVATPFLYRGGDIQT
jgi:hypothetical protein